MSTIRATRAKCPRRFAQRYLATIATDPVPAPNPGPLTGYTILELGQLIAGPFSTQLLAHFGATVIKVEPPTGDPLRVWRELDIDGTSPWWRSIGRNKRSVVLDMRKEEGRNIVKELACKVDVLSENFKPGTLEKWGLGPKDLHPLKPDLIFTRVSGYGQTGPWAHRGGYASVCEAESGFRYINGFPDADGKPLGAPVRPNISLGDSIAGLHAAFGTVLSLLAKSRGEKRGQVVDVSILESMMNLMEGIVPEYDRKGKIRGPSGSSVTGIVPTNAYPTSEPGTFIVIGANGDSIYNRLMERIGRSDLIGDAYKNNAERIKTQDVIEKAILGWTSQHTPHEVLEAMEQARVPVGRIMNVEDLIDHPHLTQRGSIETVHVSPPSHPEGWGVRVGAVAPFIRVDNKPIGGTKWGGPELGEDSDDVLREYLGMSDERLQELRAMGILGGQPNGNGNGKKARQEVSESFGDCKEQMADGPGGLFRRPVYESSERNGPRRPLSPVTARVLQISPSALAEPKGERRSQQALSAMIRRRHRLAEVHRDLPS